MSQIRARHWSDLTIISNDLIFFYRMWKNLRKLSCFLLYYLHLRAQTKGYKIIKLKFWREFAYYFFTHFTHEKIPQLKFPRSNFSIDNNISFYLKSFYLVIFKNFTCQIFVTGSRSCSWRHGIQTLIFCQFWWIYSFTFSSTRHDFCKVFLVKYNKKFFITSRN